MNTETRSFKMHPKLLFDVITRQAGTLSKAFLEAAMNSIDAGSTKCEITLSPNKVTISDDGRGFQSRTEIESFFEVFGQPHAESEGKRYGAFRMGRGQLFAFGRNRWASGPFRMDIDIKNKGLDYELLASETPAAGCSIEIEFYEPLRPIAVIELERSFEGLVAYAPIPVVLNGRTLSESPKTGDWPIETDEAFMKIKVGGNSGLRVFNLGVHVADLSSYTHGCSGTIVSRRQLGVNFARNDIMASDPVWKKINAKVRELVDGDVANKKKLSSSERAFALRKLLAAPKEWEHNMDVKLFTDCTGRGWSLRQISTRWSRRTSDSVFAFAPRNSHSGDLVMQHKLAMVFDEEMLDLVGAKSPGEFWDRALSADFRDGSVHSFTFGRIAKMSWRPIDELAALINQKGSVLIDPKDWTSKEKMLINAIGQGAGSIIDVLGRGGVESSRRDFHIGESETAAAWTDGSTYIALSRRLLGRSKSGAAGLMEVMLTVLHEYCHNTADIGDHCHDEDFYRLYHDSSFYIGDACAAAAASYLKQLRNLDRRIPMKALKSSVLDDEGTQLESKLGFA